jgi:formamidopyrimidine-DNA glycosylase
MPELPDITTYVEALERHVTGRTLEKVRLRSPFLLRSVQPRLTEVHGRTVTGFHNIGKRIVWEFEDEEPSRFLVLHLMIAGRLRKKKKGAKLNRKIGLAAFDFDEFTIVLTEASTKKRASLHVVGSREELAEHDPGGIDVFDATADQFQAALTRNNHTIKRALTDPRYLSGIGNAYSDEILHRARMSPFKLTQSMSDEEFEHLHAVTKAVLREWTDRLRGEIGDGFPDKVTAFRPEMAVHGKYGEPCPVCGREVQRVRYAENEMNYCAECQTGGKLLADRSLSRLLKKDGPKTIDELETHIADRKV